MGQRQGFFKSGQAWREFRAGHWCFVDELSLTVPDPDHSEGEQRYLIFGQTPDGSMLVVSFTDRGDKIRIISARKMTRRERQAYEQ